MLVMKVVLRLLLLLVWVWAMLLPRSPPGWSAGGWPVVQVPYRLDH